MGRQDQQNLSESIVGHIAAFARTVAHSVLLMKLFIIVAGCVGAVMQFAPSGGQPPTTWQIIGGVAAALVAIFGIFISVAEKDASAMLQDANKALIAAQEADAASEDYIQEINDYADQIAKSVELYVVMGNARDIYERVLTTGSQQLEKLLQDVLSTSKRHLAAAMDIKTADRWTLCIYRARQGAHGSRELEVVAHIRAIECNVSDARVWPEGVGFAGISLSTGQEIIVGDMADVSIGQIYNVGNGLIREHDANVYKSAIACPIYIGDEDRPWGIATATNDRRNHFVDEGTPGVHNGEAVRAVANMAAMIVSLCSFTRAPQTTQNDNEQ